MADVSFKFGTNAALFGVYHPPEGEARLGVVFCPPFAEEKKCSYRTFTTAARTFALAGVACLRFDYFGTGDSGGRFTDFSPSRAIDDIATAADELCSRSGVSDVVLLGLRLGGTLALAAAARSGAASVILWEPVVSGRSFFDLTIKRQMMRRQLIGSTDPGDRCPPVRTGEHLSDDIIDLDGFPLSRAAAEEIRSLDCATAGGEYDGPIRLLQISHTENVSREYGELAAALGDRADVAAVKCPPFWNRIELADTTEVVDKTMAWLG